MPIRLTLSLIAGPDNVRPQTRIVETAPFTLGRGSGEVNWTLPDSEQVLSRRHCVFVLHGGGWGVTDLSGNGTFFNHEAARMERGETRRLRDGDRLRLGCYEFQVQLTETPPPVLETGVLSDPVPPPAGPPPAGPPGPAGEGAALLAAFLQGAGMPPGMAPKDPVAAMQALGAAFRAMVTGLRRAQLARRTVRSGFRINQTAWSSNPLKVAVSDEDALVALLGAGRPSPMPPARAVGEMLREIALHEVVTMAAMQEAVRTLLASLDPVRLRETAGPGGLLPLQRKARAWDCYEAQYAAVVQALADDFDSVFGRAFARAYERGIAGAAEREPP